MKSEGLIESIRSRLLNLSRENGEVFDFVLSRFGVERFLYRLGVSGEADRFVLKGATLFHVWNRKMHRPTRDLDLLGLGIGDADSVRKSVLAIMRIEALVRLDAQNTRMKDFFDLEFLLRDGELDRDILREAVHATFAQRDAELPIDTPAGLSDRFAREKQVMWNAFLRKNGLVSDELVKVISTIRKNLEWVWRK